MSSNESHNVDLVHTGGSIARFLKVLEIYRRIRLHRAEQFYRTYFFILFIRYINIDFCVDWGEGVQPEIPGMLQFLRV